MKEIKVRFPHYWIELPYNVRLVELAHFLAHSHLRLRWNMKDRRLEVSAQ